MAGAGTWSTSWPRAGEGALPLGYGAERCSSNPSRANRSASWGWALAGTALGPARGYLLGHREGPERRREHPRLARPWQQAVLPKGWGLSPLSNAWPQGQDGAVARARLSWPDGWIGRAGAAMRAGPDPGRERRCSVTGQFRGRSGCMWPTATRRSVWWARGRTTCRAWTWSCPNGA